MESGVEVLDLIRNFYNLNREQYPGLRCGHFGFISHPDCVIPDFSPFVEIEQFDDKITWSYKIPEELEESTTIQNSEFEVTERKKYLLKHDFVSQAFSAETTDVPLQSIFGVKGDDFDRLSPDICKKDLLGMIHFVEISTSRRSDDLWLKTKLQDKIFKYEGPLFSRVDDDVITLTVIIVSEHSVCSNIRLPQEVVNELCIRMKIALSVENVAKGKGIVLYEDEVFSENRRVIESIKREIGRISDQIPSSRDKLEITEEFARQVLEDAKPEEAQDCFIEASKRAYNNVKSTTDHRKKYKEFIKRMSEKEDTSMRMKPTCIFPLINLEPTTPDTNIGRVVINPHTGKEPLGKVWSLAFSQSKDKTRFAEENKKSLLKEALESNEKKLIKMEKIRKEGQRKYRRVDILKNLKMKEKRLLQRDGLFAKSAKNESWLKARRKEQSRPINFNIDTNDIDEFIKGNEVFDENNYLEHYGNKLSRELISNGQDLMGNTEEGDNFLLKWSKTKIYNSLLFISDICMELAISIKQNCDSGEMILKKLKHYNAYLLISPTNSKSHMFFSILIVDFKRNMTLAESPFRIVNQVGRHGITDFVSIRTDKLENLVQSPYMLLTLVSFWGWAYGINEPSPHSIKSNPKAYQMILTSLLVQLEDKAETEETLTLTRYMYMETFKSIYSIKEPNPLKMLDKFNENPRSRLNIYFMKRIAINFLTMALSKPTRKSPDKTTHVIEDEDSLPGDEWTGLLNCITGEQIKTAGFALNIMYLGYLKNKNEEAQGNIELKLIEKILEEEFKYDHKEVNKSYGDVKPEEVPKPKQFNINCVKVGCDLMSKELSRSLGPQWKYLLGDEIYVELGRQLTHEIATLKASSMLQHKSFLEEIKNSKSPYVRRVKVLESIACDLDTFGLNPMENLKRILEKVEKTGWGVIVDLFKKHQHGGLREIYVLTILSRVLQLFIEVSSRTLCKHFQEETLTHPENKIRLLDLHKIRCAKIARARECVYADYCSSLDKTRWNQNLIMPLLSIPLLRLLPSEFHCPIIRILNLWSKKLIRIPPQVCNLLYSNVNLNNETYMELKTQFREKKYKGDKPKVVPKQHCAFVTVKTGMMQGILHYTSSLLHICFLKTASHYILKSLNMKYPQNRFIMTQVCSSDDSACIITCFSKKGETNFSKEELIPFCATDFFGYTLSEFCKYFSMKDSEKSTVSCVDYIEYNSEFLFKNTLSIPIFKFVAASLNLSESESLPSRFHSQYNLISDLYASGFPSYNTHLCQLSQGMLHYKTMGSSTSPLFEEYQKRLVQVPHPMYGFFPVDTQYVTGLLGFNYSCWKIFTRNVQVNNMLNTLHYSELNTTSDGNVIQSLNFKHGDLWRWTQLLSRVIFEKLDILPDKTAGNFKDKLKRLKVIVENNQKKILTGNAELLFRHPENRKELKEKLTLLSSMPGVAKSLQKGVPFLQACALSVYCLNTHCLTKVTTEFKKDRKGDMKRIKISKKTNILLELERVIQNTELEIDEERKHLCMTILFPLQEKYKEVDPIIESFKRAELVPVHRLRCKRTFITIQPRIIKLPLTLRQCVCKLWFGFKVKTTEGVWRRCMGTYRALYPWLKDSFEETQRYGPFETPVELYTFINSVSQVIRKFLRVGPSISSSKLTGQVAQLIRKAYRANYLMERKRKDKVVTYRGTDHLQTVLSLSLAIPDKTIRDQKTIEILRDSELISKNLEETHNLSKRDYVISILQLYQQKKINLQEFFSDLRNGGCGYLLSFTKAQNREEKDGKILWTGEGECVAICDSIELKLQLVDKMCVKITCRRWNLLKLRPDILRDLFQTLKVQNSNSTIFAVKCVGRFNGSEITHPANAGTPIIVDDDFYLPYFEPDRTRFDIHFYRVGIYSKDRRCDLPILEYKVGQRDINILPRGGSGEEIWDCWINQKKLKSLQATAIIRELAERIRNKRIILSDKQKLMIEWFSSTLKNRLKYRNVGFSEQIYTESLATSIFEDSDDSEDIDIDKELRDFYDEPDFFPMESLAIKFTADLADEALKNAWSESNEVTEDDEQKVLENMFNPDYNFSPLGHILLNWAEEQNELSRQVAGNLSQNYHYMHPLWDDFIDGALRIDPTFFAKILKGAISSNDRELSQNLMTILGIKETRQESTLSSRARNVVVPFIENLFNESDEGDYPEVEDNSNEFDPYWSD